MLRRFIMMVIGMGVGALAFAAAESLMVSLPPAAGYPKPPDYDLPPSFYALDGRPLMMAHVACFGTLFLLLRWWRQADPLRPARLSLWTLIVTGVLAGHRGPGVAVPAAVAADGRRHDLRGGAIGQPVDTVAKTDAHLKHVRVGAVAKGTQPMRSTRNRSQGTVPIFGARDTSLRIGFVAAKMGLSPLRAEGDRSMFSADVLFAKRDFSPKNGPVPPARERLRPKLYRSVLCLTAMVLFAGCNANSDSATESISGHFFGSGIATDRVPSRGRILRNLSRIVGQSHRTTDRERIPHDPRGTTCCPCWKAAWLTERCV